MRSIPATAALLLAAGAVLLGLCWADAPLNRRHELLRLPIRLVEGQRIRDSFTPEHDGPVAVEICFPRPIAEDVDVRGIVAGSRSPSSVAAGSAGLQVTCTIRHGAEVALRSTTGADLLSWRTATKEIAVTVARWDRGRAGPTALEVHVDRAAPELADAGASLLVAASGDWIHYAWLDAKVRRAGVVGGAVVLLVAALGARWLSARRRRRAARPRG